MMHERIARASVTSEAGGAARTRARVIATEGHAPRAMHRFERIAPAVAGRPPMQMRWIRVPNTPDPGDWYWEGRGDASGSPPYGGRAVAAPALTSQQDVHTARGGSMKALRVVPHQPTTPMDFLAFAGSQASQGRGAFFEGQTTQRGLGSIPVQTSIPKRDKAEHTNIFSKMTGGERSSTNYQQQLGTAAPGTKYQILHGVGHGEGGKQTQSPQNLASASKGANSEMIPFDKAISGNPNVLVQTHFNIRPGTERAESINQQFAHKDYPNEPFFQRTIDGDRPEVSDMEWDSLESRAEKFQDAKTLEAAAALRRMAEGKSSFGGRLGQFAPGNHPNDFRGNRDDDDDDNMIS